MVKVVKDAQDLSDRIKRISGAVQEAISLWAPDAISIEDVFFAKNPKSALKLGQARGAALVPVALADLPIFEYAPTLVKQTIAGSGRAEKAQVQKMVRVILGSKVQLEFEREDASDALAIAICHLQHRHKHRILLASGIEQKKVVALHRGR